MSLFRSSPSAFRAGLGVRSIHTSRVVTLQSTRPRLDAVVAADETGGFKYVPGGPILKGTVNDATTYPSPSKAHGSYHWAFERLLSAALIPLSVGAAVASPTAHPILDGILGVSLIVHSHIGFDACIEDYVHERKWGNWSTVARWALRFGTAGAVWGVYEFNTNDIGLTELIAKVWKA